MITKYSSQHELIICYHVLYYFCNPEISDNNDIEEYFDKYMSNIITDKQFSIRQLIFQILTYLENENIIVFELNDDYIITVINLEKLNNLFFKCVLLQKVTK